MRYLVIALCCAAGLSATATLAPGTAAAQAKSTSVLKSELQGADGLEANIVRFEVEPGWTTARHIHPGHLFVLVTEGTLEVAVEGKEPQTISAGDAFYEMPDNPMIGRNASSTEGAKFIVFQVGPKGEPLMVEQPE